MRLEQPVNGITPAPFVGPGGLDVLGLNHDPLPGDAAPAQ